MDERDLFDYLTPDRGHEARAFLKRAGVKELAESLKSKAILNSPKLLAGAATAAGFGLAHALLNRKSKKTGLSTYQRISRAVTPLVESLPFEGSLPKGMARISSRTANDLSDLYAEHPKGSALLAAGAGALQGEQLRKLIFDL